jgi:thiopurine S-methyltransferase
VQTDFWDDHWRQGRIGFHRTSPHPALRDHWSRLELPYGSRVLVPLCGKSVDLLWLHEAGHDVVGVEWSAIAVESFCLENGVPARRRTRDGFDVFESPRLALWRGDYFALTAGHAGRCVAAYDRAALVAFGPDRRAAYAQHTAALLPPGARLLLVTVEYAQDAMPGPPFAVAAGEVRALYGPAFDVEELDRRDVLAEEPKMRARGLDRFAEAVYRLVRRPPVP